MCWLASYVNFPTTGQVLNHGSLLEDFEPSVNPPAEIDDPEDFKPSDWDEREKIPGQFFN